MNHSFYLAAVVLGAALPVHADLFSVNFDGVPSGTPANAVAPAGLSFEPAGYLPDYDLFGDPIPGTDKWRVDLLAPMLTIENPADYGRGDAPSPFGALNALLQPTLVLFTGATHIDFSITLDNDVFGDAALDLLFLDSRGDIVGSVPVDQTVPGFVASHNGFFSNVSQILLPAGAFYDNLSVTAVPESGPGVSGLAIGLLALTRWFQTRNQK